jgi:hypothetical protein
MKRALRWLALIGATVYGTALVLDLPASSKEDAPALILIGGIFAFAITAYLYLTRNSRRRPK